MFSLLVSKFYLNWNAVDYISICVEHINIRFCNLQYCVLVVFNKIRYMCIFTGACFVSFS